MRDLGAELVFFSPLANQAIPASADAVYLPGGYPELHAQTLTQAHVWLASIRAAHASGMPIWAECGGMMSITEGLVDQNEQAWPMAGLLAGIVHMQKRLAALGGQKWTHFDESGKPAELRGHTFHYSRFETHLQPVAQTTKQRDGAAGEAIYQSGSCRASYFHAYFPSNLSATANLFLPVQS